MSNSPLTNTELCNHSALRKAARRISQLYDVALAPCCLRTTQMSILVHIDRLQKPSMGALAEALVLDRSALAHNLKPLERDGLAKVVIDKGDKRRRHAILTSVGYDKLAEARTLWRGAQARFEAAYGVDRAARLRVELNQIAEDGFAQAFNEAKITPSPQKRGAG